MRYGNPSNENRRTAEGTFRRAVTLIEMLIVLFIVSLLAVMALRALPGEDQKPREAARMLNGYISAAKNAAASTGKPAGIILQPSTTPAYPNYSTIIEQCEVPPSYSGEMVSLTQPVSKLLAQDWTMVPNTSGAGPSMVPYCVVADARNVIKLLLPPGEFTEKLIRYGDKIQINGQGPIYTICWDGTDGLYSAPPASYVANGKGTLIVAKNPQGSPLVQTPPLPLIPGKKWPDEYNFPNTKDENNQPDPNGYISCLTSPPSNDVNATITPDNLWINNYCVTCYLDPRDQVQLPWPKSNSGDFRGQIPPFSFIIIRQPEKSPVTQLQLPAGSGIDLQYSGVDSGLDSGGLFFPPAGVVGILFSPNGSVDALSVNGILYPHPTKTIYLLIGKTTVFTGDLASSEPDNNWFDLKNIIVSINPQTGVVSTNPVYPPFYNTSTPNPGPPFANEPPANMQNEFKPDSPPQYIWSKPLSDPANAPFVQALFYSRKYAREAQTMGGKR